MPEVPRKQTDPGGFTLDQDEEPTNPGVDKPSTESLALTRIIGGLSKPDRMRAIQLLERWAGMTLNQRVLVSALCEEMGG